MTSIIRKMSPHRSLRSLVAVSISIVGSAITPKLASAQNAPPGYIYDLAAADPGPTPQNYTLFTTSFVAGDSQFFTTVNFAFRETPAYFGFDDVSVVAAGTHHNLLSDPGFEDSASAVGTSFPGNQWGRWIQPIDTAAIGEVSTATSPYGCSSGPHSGVVFWCDGSVQGYDGIYQTVATLPGTTYDVSFYLDDNSSSDWVGTGTSPQSQVDALVYAISGVNAIPINTSGVGPAPPAPSAVPEPAAAATMSLAMACLTMLRRYRPKHRRH